MEKHPGRRFYHALELAQNQLRDLQKRHFWTSLYHGVRPVGIFLLVLAADRRIRRSSSSAGTTWQWAAVSSGGTAAIVSIVVAVWSYHVAKRQSIEKYLALRHTMLEAGLGNPAVLETAKTDCERLDATIIARHKAQSQKADKEFAAATARIERRRQNDQQRADAEFPRRLADLAAWRDQMLEKIEEKYPPLLRQIEQHYADESQRIHDASRHRPGREPAAIRPPVE